MVTLSHGVYKYEVTTYFWPIAITKLIVPARNMVPIPMMLAVDTHQRANGTKLSLEQRRQVSHLPSTHKGHLPNVQDGSVPMLQVLVNCEQECQLVHTVTNH